MLRLLLRPYWPLISSSSPHFLYLLCGLWFHVNEAAISYCIRSYLPSGRVPFFRCEMQWITALLWILNFILEMWRTEPALQLDRTPKNNLFPTRSYFYNLQSSTCPLSTANWRLKLQPFNHTDLPSKCFSKKLATTWKFFHELWNDVCLLVPRCVECLVTLNRGRGGRWSYSLGAIRMVLHVFREPLCKLDLAGFSAYNCALWFSVYWCKEPILTLPSNNLEDFHVNKYLLRHHSFSLHVVLLWSCG